MDGAGVTVEATGHFEGEPQHEASSTSDSRCSVLLLGLLAGGKPVRVLSVNNSDIVGGAARAAWRIHQAVRKFGVESTMLVEQSTTCDWTVKTFDSRRERVENSFRALLERMLKRRYGVIDGAVSPAWSPSRWPGRIDALAPDVVHLHWVYGGMMSLEDIARIERPVVWTMHDMWPFCGAEHYATTDSWKSGYQGGTTPLARLNRSVWSRKRQVWKTPRHMVAPSRWMGECASNSPLMEGWEISVVPNPIDLDVWAPFDSRASRQILGLPPDRPLVAFGAMGGCTEPRKGFDLLRDSLRRLASLSEGIELVVFGERRPKDADDLGFPAHYLGHLHDDASLRLLYCAVDAMAIPSRQDNLPNTGVEALACGTPVVAFDACGMRDIVRHENTGWLAKAFDTQDFAQGISWVIDPSRRQILRGQARAYAQDSFSEAIVGSRYNDIYCGIHVGN